MIVAKEYTIKVLAPEGGKCCIYACHKNACHSVVIEDDTGKCQAHYQNLCELHTITMILESLTEQF